MNGKTTSPNSLSGHRLVALNELPVIVKYPGSSILPVSGLPIHHTERQFLQPVVNLQGISDLLIAGAMFESPKTKSIVNTLFTSKNKYVHLLFLLKR